MTGVSQPADLLVRFVLGPGNRVVPDVDERLPGRGFWLSARRDVVETAVKRKVFGRAARADAQADADLAARLEALLLRRCQDGLGLARRAGRAVAGFDKVAEALDAGEGGLLVEAADGRPDGLRKIAAAVRRADSVAVRTVAGPDAAELGFPFGRERAVHVFVAAGPLADRIERDVLRLAAYRGGPAGAEAGAKNGKESGT